MGEIRIDNKANVDIGDPKEYAKKLSAYSNLPSGSFIWLILHNGSLKDRQGACVHKSLAYEAQALFVLNGSHLQEKREYDCQIAISKKWCYRKNQYPAYFEYLVGHELGHAKICISDIELHKLYCLIEEYFRKGNQRTQMAQYKLPHEKRFDKFGIYMSENFYDRSILDAELERLINTPNCEDVHRLKWMQATDGSDDLKPLKKELIDFTKQYKPDLIDFWQKEKKKTCPNVAKKIDDLNQLLDGLV